MRFFAGTFLWKSNNFGSSAMADVRYRLSGQTGDQDYLYDNIYLGRNETSGLLSRQMTNSDGGFKVLTFRGQTSEYLTTLNLNTTLPGKIPLRQTLKLNNVSFGEQIRFVLNIRLLNPITQLRTLNL
jgi:hypothetical protein